MRPDRKTVFLAGRPGSPLAYIGTSVNIRRSLAHMNAMRDPGDPIELLWSAPSNSGLDVVILKALAKHRRLPGRWHDLGNVDAVITSINAIMASERELAAREDALLVAEKAHADAIAALAFAPRRPRAAIVRLIRAHAGGGNG